MIPQELQPFFWDVNIENFRPQQYPKYAIGRILELGTEPAVAWMKHTFAEEQIKQVIREDERLSARSANYWALVYGIPVDQVCALARPPAQP